MRNDERNARVRVSRIAPVRSCCTCATSGLSATSRFSNATERSGTSPSARHQHIADLPRERHLLADRQLRVEHGRSAGERGAIGSRVEVRRERRRDRHEPEHEAEMPRTHRQVRGDTRVVVGDRQRTQHVTRKPEAGAEHGEGSGQVAGARRGSNARATRPAAMSTMPPISNKGALSERPSRRVEEGGGERAHDERAGERLVLPDLDD